MGFGSRTKKFRRNLFSKSTRSNNFLPFVIKKWVKISFQWVITEQACYFFSMVTVPLYDTLGPEACSFIISQGTFIFLRSLR